MKKLFYIGLVGLGLWEILKVYLIMPMPGSQQSNTIDLAYFIHSYRWVFRVLFTAMILAGSPAAFQVKRKWLPAVAVVPVLVIIYFFNIKSRRDEMFIATRTKFLCPLQRSGIFRGSESFGSSGAGSRDRSANYRYLAALRPRTNNTQLPHYES